MCVCVCACVRACVCVVQLKPLPHHYLTLHWSPKRLTFLVLAYPDCPHEEPDKWVLLLLLTLFCNRCFYNEESVCYCPVSLQCIINLPWCCTEVQYVVRFMSYAAILCSVFVNGLSTVDVVDYETEGGAETCSVKAASSSQWLRDRCTWQWVTHGQFCCRWRLHSWSVWCRGKSRGWAKGKK